MLALAVSDAGSVVSAAVAALVVIFLTLPIIFLLAERARDGRLVLPRAVKVHEAARPARDRRGLEVRASAEFAHDFEDEELPRTVGHVPPDATIEGPLEFAGHLQIGERATIRGDVRARGSVALGAGALVTGGIATGGHLHATRTSRVQGLADVAGDVSCGSYATLGAVRAGGRVLLAEGARIERDLEASQVERRLDRGRVDPVRHVRDVPVHS